MQNKFLRTSILFGLKLKSEQQEKTQKGCGAGVKMKGTASQRTKGSGEEYAEGQGHRYGRK